MHTLMYSISFNKFCSVATLGHPETFPLPNHLRIVAVALDFGKGLHYSVIKFLYHSSTIKLLLLLIRTKWFYFIFKASAPCLESQSALWLLWHANLCQVATPVGTAQNNPAQPIIITTGATLFSYVIICQSHGLGFKAATDVRAKLRHARP